MTKEPEVIKDWLDQIHNHGVNLTKWEQDFIDSVHEQFNERNWISDKQEEILERIYAERA